MSKNARDRRPYIKPVTRLELDQSNVKLRWILVAVFFVIAIVAFGIGMNEILKTEPGWQSVRSSSDQPNSGSEFVLMYDYSGLGATASQVNKALETKYSEVSADAFAIFSGDISREGLLNVSYVNQSPNQKILVDPALYGAFELLERYGNRSIFLAPVYVEYDRIFASESDPEAAENDPAKNPAVKAYIDELIRYTSDEQMIRLELLGDNRICLHVDEAYLAYAQENGIEEFIDFGWMRNAFVIDYMAEQLVSAGYTNGYLASYEGFTRNLMDTDQSFSLNLFNLEGKDITIPAVLDYVGRTSIVFLHSYPLDELDTWSNYVYEDGSIVTAMIDPEDGVSKSSLNNLVSYSKDFGCAEILMNMAPVFVTDTFRTEAANVLTDRQIYSVWFEGGNLYYNDADLKLTLLEDQAGNVLQANLAK